MRPCYQHCSRRSQTQYSSIDTTATFARSGEAAVLRPDRARSSISASYCSPLVRCEQREVIVASSGAGGSSFHDSPCGRSPLPKILTGSRRALRVAASLRNSSRLCARCFGSSRAFFSADAVLAAVDAKRIAARTWHRRRRSARDAALVRRQAIDVGSALRFTRGATFDGIPHRALRRCVSVAEPRDDVSARAA